jgi:hypothetical protein
MNAHDIAVDQRHPWYASEVFGLVIFCQRNFIFLSHNSFAFSGSTSISKNRLFNSDILDFRLLIFNPPSIHSHLRFLPTLILLILLVLHMIPLKLVANFIGLAFRTVACDFLLSVLFVLSSHCLHCSFLSHIILSFWSLLRFSRRMDAYLFFFSAGYILNVLLGLFWSLRAEYALFLFILCAFSAQLLGKFNILILPFCFTLCRL